MTQFSSESNSQSFEVSCDRLSDRTYRFRIHQAETTGYSTMVTWQAAIDLWQHSPAFRSSLTQALADVPFAAFFWETPAITTVSLPQPWECVAVAAPSLGQTPPDVSPFNDYLERDVTGVIATFPNLGGDALLVVPHPQGAIAAYAHIATFVRRAPAHQIHQLWQVLGQTVQQHIAKRNGQPLWVSTSGLGVAWLHIRLDDRPKYYTHPPYRIASMA